MTREATTATPARRGDLAVLLSHSRTSYVSGPSATCERVEIGRVTSVTRQGVVKEVAIPSTRDDRAPTSRRVGSGAQVLIVSVDQIDVDAALEAYRQHTWEGKNAIKPLEGIAEAREMLRPLRRKAGDG